LFQGNFNLSDIAIISYKNKRLSTSNEKNHAICGRCLKKNGHQELVTIKYGDEWVGGGVFGQGKISGTYLILSNRR
jgi:hypothetical protein